MSDRTSLVYSASLHELRDNHEEEFSAIYMRRLDEAGIEPKWLRDAERKNELLEVIRQNPGISRIELYQACPYVTGGTLGKWVAELRDEGLIETPGRGNRHGYRAVR